MGALRIFAFALLLAILGPGMGLADERAWRAAGWRTDFSKRAVDLGEIMSGGPPRDGIPSIDQPKFRKASDVTDMGGHEPVIALSLGGETRAYPLRILTWHEIVNDVVGGRPVAVTYCPLCNSAVVFDRIVDGRALEFGVSGLLRNSDLVMYDRATESWWQQYSGEAIVGAMAGRSLPMIPARVTGFAAFQADHPDAAVLVPNDPALRPYGFNPYVNYDSRTTPYPFFRGDLPTGLKAMERVVVVRDGDAIRAVVLAHVRTVGTLVLDGVRLAWRPGVNSALDQATIAKSADVGGLTVTRIASGEALVHDITFAFVVQAFHPGIAVLTGKGPVVLKP
jgi:hypothetical protein